MRHDPILIASHCSIKMKYAAVRREKKFKVLWDSSQEIELQQNEQSILNEKDTAKSGETNVFGYSVRTKKNTTNTLLTKNARGGKVMRRNRLLLLCASVFHVRLDRFPTLITRQTNNHAIFT